MVKIRLRREGAKGRPFYRIVVADQRARREGAFIEVIGTHDPLKEEDQTKIDLEKVDTARRSLPSLQHDWDYSFSD